VAAVASGLAQGAVVYLPQGLHCAVQQDQLQRCRQWLLLEHGEEVGTVVGNEDRCSTFGPRFFLTPTQ
jgi:hypothetical protein